MPKGRSEYEGKNILVFCLRSNKASKKDKIFESNITQFNRNIRFSHCLKTFRHHLLNRLIFEKSFRQFTFSQNARIVSDVNRVCNIRSCSVITRIQVWPFLKLNSTYKHVNFFIPAAYINVIILILLLIIQEQIKHSFSVQIQKIISAIGHWRQEYSTPPHQTVLSFRYIYWFQPMFVARENWL